MKDEIMQVLNWLKEQGVDFSGIKKSMLQDARPTNKIFRLLEIAFIDMKAYPRLKTAFTNNADYAVNDLANELHNDYAIDKDTAAVVIECVGEILGYAIPDVPTETVVKQTQAEKQPAPVQPPLPPNPNSDVKIGSIIDFGVYKWRVLDVQRDKALLITDDIVEQREYHEQLVGITWENCDLRKYLNGEFLSKFDSSKIALTTNQNPNNQWYGTSGGNATQDKVFLLSLEEVDYYFGNSGDYVNKRQKKYDKGHWIEDSNGWGFSNNYDSSRAAKYGDKTFCWWLRSPNSDSRAGARVDIFGTVYVNGFGGCNSGVRPALWLSLDKKDDDSTPIPPTPPKIAPIVQPVTFDPPPPSVAKIGSLIDFGAYKWRVLDTNGNQALIVTEDVIEQQAYHAKVAVDTWENCDIRKYLNGEFLNKLDNSRIAITNNQNPNNPWFDTIGGNTTKDKIFLLSLDEVCGLSYFGNSMSKLESKGNQNYFIDDENNNKRIAKYSNKACRWWLRTPGNGIICAAVVDEDGSINVEGGFVNKHSGGVRPALWLKLD
jgi:hypothetical protein